MSRLFGRAQECAALECAALDAAVARARGGDGGSLIVTGDPGAGKSALLDYVASSAGEAETIRIEGLELRMPRAAAATMRSEVRAPTRSRRCSRR